MRSAPRWTFATTYDAANALSDGGLAAVVHVQPGDTVGVDVRGKAWRTFVQVLSDLAIISTTAGLIYGATK